MNFLILSGQESTTIDNETLNKYVKVCEKCESDKIDLEGIIREQKLIIQTLGIRGNELEEINQGLNEAVGKIKVAYNDIIDANDKKKFWIWLKGVGVGIVTGAVVVLVLIL